MESNRPLESSINAGEAGEAGESSPYNHHLLAEIPMRSSELPGSRPRENTPEHLPVVQITGGEGGGGGRGEGGGGGQGGEGGRGGGGGEGGRGGAGGQSDVSIDNSNRSTSNYKDNSIFWAPQRDATQGIPPGTMGGRLEVTLPTGQVDYAIFGPQSSSAFNLNMDLVLPGSGLGAGLGIGTAHTGDAPPEVRTAVTNLDQRAGDALTHILRKDR